MVVDLTNHFELLPNKLAFEKGHCREEESKYWEQSLSEDGNERWKRTLKRASTFLRSENSKFTSEEYETY